MNGTFTVMSALVAALFTALGTAKILRLRAMTAAAGHLGFSAAAFRLIGLLEVAGAAALVGGLFWAPLTFAAAAGLLVLLAGAVLCHRRAGDGAKEVLPAVWTAAVVVATAVVASSR